MTNETVEQLCADIKTRIDELWEQSLGAMLNGEVDEFADRIRAANTREIAAKDAEIARLRVLVGELDIALSGSLDIIGNVCEYIQADCGTMLRVETYREILAKAREEVKDGE